MKSQDTKFAKSQLAECMTESVDSAEICGLALKKIRALENKIARMSDRTYLKNRILVQDRDGAEL